ncbi:glycogen/starch/alpha-glucan phosphorylase [Ruficoccus sp. ZRK36]|uniref:glycogen/starch/alpha-glucan phosphorylase n=1 Tax=Ruficoccus sp. ZRK36 TaxID=2866311 RepID=UPI001C72E8ED|nr:glycogen/starch/alpha-glucan phosphorylase [Ruficoccus sp. ZRK36]QYY37215.1 glycogen/starch/alpha-glucan phosphorylase [Ruficoccus sp. ZRK36]
MPSSPKATKKTAKKASTAPAKKKAFNFNIDADVEGLKTSIENHLTYSLARDKTTATSRDWWLSLCYSVQDRILHRYIKTQAVHNEKDTRRSYYLSLEYLMGRLLSNNLVNAGLFDAAKQALEELGLDMDDILEEEPDMGLGNGGLGRLAACFLDSLATLDLPAVGYGIHYEFGLFRQEFIDGRQVERPDNWLQFGNPWQVNRPEYQVSVPLYGHVEYHFDSKGDSYPAWVGTKELIGLPWDIPIVGYGARTVNFLRLWESRASQEFDFSVFNEGGYVEAVREKAIGETISKVLYPNDKTESGKELRLVQQYFFCACSLHDIIRRFRKQNHDNWDAFPDKVAVQLNDTHPAVAVSELMRILVDVEKLEWERAWGICRKVFAYTNHTLLPEALEKWSVPLFQKVLPRHLQIIFEINRRFLEDEVEAQWPGDNVKKSILSIIEEGSPKQIRMAYLATVGSHSVNGVAALHTDLLKKHLFHDFNELWPNKFNNKTNGITPRRFLKVCNPGLAALIEREIGPEWPFDLDRLRGLEKLADDASFQSEYMAVKRANKERLAEIIEMDCGVTVSPDAMFDVQIKRLHEYKRQHLNLLHILTLYRDILHHPEKQQAPRVVLFGAKAAPGYELAKDIIYTINKVADVINNDKRVGDKLKVVFLPNYRVSLAERIIPAADLSEQISTAGKEASGTGNMKLALNGALTIGTLDGANVEIKEEVGDDNIFIFGMTVEEVLELRASGYNPWDFYRGDDDLKHVLDWLGSDTFTPGHPYALDPIRRSLLDGGDPFLCCADFRSYIDCQKLVSDAYLDKPRWAHMAILNTARMGKFSSDRTIREYADDIWNLKPLPVGE